MLTPYRLSDPGAGTTLHAPPKLTEDRLFDPPADRLAWTMTKDDLNLRRS